MGKRFTTLILKHIMDKKYGQNRLLFMIRMKRGLLHSIKTTKIKRYKIDVSNKHTQPPCLWSCASKTT